jgi:hypothetical protein
MRTPITRPRKCTFALRIRITAIEIIDMLCAMPASIRQAIAAGTVLISANNSSIAYQVTDAPIKRRATRTPPARLSVTEPISEPTAKLAER